MLTRDTRDHLLGILESIAVIQTFIRGMSFAAYEGDLKTRLAVERKLQILTEAAFRLKQDSPRLCPIIDWRQVRGLGNFLRHEYHKVDDQSIWNKLQQLLPLVEIAVQQALTTLKEGSPNP